MQGISALSLYPTFNRHSSDELEDTVLNVTQAFSGMDLSAIDVSQSPQVCVSEDNDGEAHLEEISEDHGLAWSSQPRNDNEEEEDGKEAEDNEGKEEEEEDDDSEFEFSFASGDPNAFTFSADEIFCNGEIRPMYPLFNRDLLFADEEGDFAASDKASTPRLPLRKIFVEKSGEHPSSSSTSESDELEAVLPGTYCAWSGKAVEASAESCKKSNSTGFSKLWRFRDLVRRSNSDGKDAFVFLDPSAAKAAREHRDEKGDGTRENEKTAAPVENKNSGHGKAAGGAVAGKGVKGGKKVTAHESLYIKNRASREGGRRKSYLPYRVGFFTNVNGLSRNIHPF